MTGKIKNFVARVRIFTIDLLCATGIHYETILINKNAVLTDFYCPYCDKHKYKWHW